MQKYRIILYILLMSASLSRGQNDVYNHFAADSNLQVAYIGNYRLDDTDAVNIVMVRAYNLQDWVKVIRDINLPEATIEEVQKNNTVPSMGFSYRKKENFRELTDINHPGIYRLWWIHDEMTLLFFEISSKEQIKKLSAMMSQRLGDKVEKYKKTKP